MHDALQRARAAVAAAHSLAVLTGAGLSAESGVPTFRGSSGLWRSFRPEDLATPEAFARDPSLVWEWYDWRRARIAAAEPNAGHRALAELERRPAGLTHVTQNVDGLHRLAGSRHVLELHGDIWTLRCTGCGRAHEDRRVPLAPLPPRCACGALERPGVVWFGEALPGETLAAAFGAARRAEVVLVVGTSSVVYPAAAVAEAALAAGRTVIEINPEVTPLTPHASLALHGRAAQVLPALVP